MNRTLHQSNPLIKNLSIVQRFRDILYFQIGISTSTFVLLLILRFPLLSLISFIGIDPSILLKIIIGIIALAALLFTPYIFFVLIKEKKFGWIILYFIVIPIPEVLGYLIFKDTLAFEAALLIPIVFFYFYCYLIKFEVDKWLADYNWHQERFLQKKETEERIKNEMIL